MAEVANLPVEPKSAESLTIMIKDFESILAKYQAPGRKITEKIAPEDVAALKQYNKFFQTKITSTSVAKTLIDRLTDLRLEQGVMNMPSPGKFKSTGKITRPPPKEAK